MIFKTIGLCIYIYIYIDRKPLIFEYIGLLIQVDISNTITDVSKYILSFNLQFPKPKNLLFPDLGVFDIVCYF